MLPNAEKGQVMPRLTSLHPRDETHRPRGRRRRPCAATGPDRRLELEFIRPNRSFTRNWKRASNVHDASYVLALPRPEAWHSARMHVPFRKAGRVVLLSELAFYELLPDKNARLLVMRIPAAELRGRLVSIEDHVSRRFKPNEQMTRLLVGMIKSVAKLFINSPPPNPQALATEIISFVALTIGSRRQGCGYRRSQRTLSLAAQKSSISSKAISATSLSRRRKSLRAAVFR